MNLKKGKYYKVKIENHRKKRQCQNPLPIWFRWWCASAPAAGGLMGIREGNRQESFTMQIIISVTI